jgi:hypothetical protein
LRPASSSLASTAAPTFTSEMTTRGLAHSFELSFDAVVVAVEVELLEVVGVKLELEPLELAMTVGVLVVADGTSVKLDAVSASPAVEVEDATSVFSEASTLDGASDLEACSVSSSEVDAWLASTSEAAVESCSIGLSEADAWLATTSELVVEPSVTGASVADPLDASLVNEESTGAAVVA